jgi:hypothetical protein
LLPEDVEHFFLSQLERKDASPRVYLRP